MKPHHDRARMLELLEGIRKYQELAATHGIEDIFQDNGGKILQLLIHTGLTVLPGREGNDAVDEDGREYEFKTLNLDKTSSFSTHHHLNLGILDKYRSVGWIFGVYRGIELVEISSVEPALLEDPYFERWEKRLRGGKDHINNPKISLSHVKTHGRRIYPLEE